MVYFRFLRKLKVSTEHWKLYNAIFFIVCLDEVLATHWSRQTQLRRTAFVELFASVPKQSQSTFHKTNFLLFIYRSLTGKTVFWAKRGPWGWKPTNCRQRRDAAKRIRPALKPNFPAEIQIFAMPISRNTPFRKQLCFRRNSFMGTIAMIEDD